MFSAFAFQNNRFISFFCFFNFRCIFQAFHFGIFVRIIRTSNALCCGSFFFSFEDIVAKSVGEFRFLAPVQVISSRGIDWKDPVKEIRD